MPNFEFNSLLTFISNYSVKYYKFRKKYIKFVYKFKAI